MSAAVSSVPTEAIEAMARAVCPPHWHQNPANPGPCSECLRQVAEGFEAALPALREGIAAEVAVDHEVRDLLALAHAGELANHLLCVHDNALGRPMDPWSEVAAEAWLLVEEVRRLQRALAALSAPVQAAEPEAVDVAVDGNCPTCGHWVGAHSGGRGCRTLSCRCPNRLVVQAAEEVGGDGDN